MDEIFDKLTPYRNEPKTTGIFSDLDGTLSEIANKPDKACVSSEIKAVLEKLPKIFGVVAVVTGRNAMNAKYLVGVDNIIYIGSHGLEKANSESLTLIPAAEKYESISERIVSELSQLQLSDGIAIEKKRTGAAVHYRLAKNKKEAYKKLKDMVEPVAARYSMRIDEGRNVIELKPNLEFNKGFAVRELVNEYKLKHALYIGDDITDIDAFKAMKSMRREGSIDTLCIAVSSNEVDASVIKEADYDVESVDDVKILLEWMAGPVLKPGKRL